jgi:hypothetical protein
MLAYTAHALDGDGGALGARLADAGFDVVGRAGPDVTVLGDAALRASLAAQPGLTLLNAAVVPVPSDEAVADDGFDASQDPILPRRLDGKKYPTFYGGYRTVSGYEQFTSDLAELYPELVQKVDFGESWTGDHPLRALCVTAKAHQGCKLKPDVDKPRFLVVAQTHARELTTSELTWRFLTYLVDGFNRDAQVTAVLDSTEIWVVPQVNPDGIELVQDGIKHDGFGSDSSAWQRKNVSDENSPAGGCPPPWSNSSDGIDINRNFDVDWGRTGTSKDPCSQIYGGPKAVSEPETLAQQEFFAKLYRDRRQEGTDKPAPDDTTGGMLTLHSYANQVLLPWGFTTEHAPNEVGLRSFGFRMSYFNGFAAGQAGEILYNSSGATEDWLYDQLGVAGFTWEIGPDGGSCAGFFPDYSCQDMFFDQNIEGLMYAATASRQPYTETLGPTTLSAKARDGAGQKVKIIATASDDAYGTSGVGRPDAQPVRAGRIYAHGAPWDGGKARATKVIGGGDDEARLKAKVRADDQRRHLVYLQAKDADGNWGPLRAVWVPRA